MAQMAKMTLECVLASGDGGQAVSEKLKFADSSRPQSSSLTGEISTRAGYDTWESYTMQLPAKTGWRY